VCYYFDEQDADAREGDDVYDTEGNKIGSVKAIDFGARTLEIKHRKDTADARPHTVYFHKAIGVDVIRESLMRLGQNVIDHGLGFTAPYQTALRLLTQTIDNGPGQPMRRADESNLAAAIRLSLNLDGGVLAIQGPPGTHDNDLAVDAT